MKKPRIWIEQKTPPRMYHGAGSLMASPPTESPTLYWNESRRAFVTDEGTNYKSIRAAEAAIARHKLTNCRVVLN